MAFVYILFSEKLNKFYVGSSVDKDNRLARHNSGSEKFTSTGIPWVMVYYETYGRIEDARKREREIKKKKSRKYIMWLIQFTAR